MADSGELEATVAAIVEEVRPLTRLGRVATYIPRLANVPASKLGLAAVTLDGVVAAAGDATEAFSIQSISKAFTLTLALRAVGEDLWRRVGKEPSGGAFNSLVQLEHEQGIPRNPFLNAGAHVLADIVLTHYADAQAVLLDFVRRRAHNPAVAADAEVARSEKKTGFRNAALANFLRSFGNLEHAVEDVLDFYFFQCSLALSAVDLARAFLFLANGGVCPWTGDVVLTPSQTKRVNALMLTCGTYDAAGDFAWQVGIPAKSGVGGGIAGVIPGRLAICAWSPGLNERGNSLAGTAALERFTTRTGWSVF